MNAVRTLVMVLLGAQMVWVAQAQSYELSQNGKKVGEAQVEMRPLGAGRGFTMTSGTKLKVESLDYSFNQTATLDAGYRLVQSQVSGMVNQTAASVTAARQGNGFMLRINVNGQTVNQMQAFHDAMALMPDFDPGALTVLMKMNLMGDRRGLWVLLPKQSGIESSLTVTRDPDMQGTLHGESIAVRHISLKSDVVHVEVYSDTQGNVMQAEWPDEALALVEKDFVLTPPPHAQGPPPQKTGQ